MGVSATVIRTPDRCLRVSVSPTMRKLEREGIAAMEAIRSQKVKCAHRVEVPIV